MKKIEFLWTPEAHINITGLEISILIDASAAHYDLLCRKASQDGQYPAPNGFLMVWANRWHVQIDQKFGPNEKRSWTDSRDKKLALLRKEHKDEPVTIPFVTLQELNLCVKMLEYRGSLEVSQERDDLRKSIKNVFDDMSREYNEKNKQAMENLDAHTSTRPH